MKIGSLVAAVLAFVIAAIAADPVHASCESRYRVNKDRTSCLSGSAKGVEWNAKTQGSVTTSCAETPYMPKMKVKVDIRGAADWTRTITGNITQGYKEWGSTRSQNCCHDYGPCWKNEVKGPEITWRIIGDSSESGTATLNTCRGADEFCADDKMEEKTWYCKKSFYEEHCGSRHCGWRYCDTGDCRWHWDQSDASDTCTRLYSSWSHESKRCIFNARCIKGEDPTNTKFNETYVVKVSDADDLVNCNGTLQDEDAECDN